MAQFNGRAKLEEAPVTKDKKTGKSKPKSPRVRVFYSNGKNPKELDFLLSPEQWPYDLELARQGCEVTVLVENGRVIKVAPKGVEIKYTPEKPKGSGLRDATANYNFVDYDEKRVINAEDTSTELYSGKIVCSLSTMPNSPLLVAGPSNKEDKKAKDRKFINVNNEPVTSGSSLKGMIRALVEVMSYSRIHHVSNEKIFFKEISSSNYKKFIGPVKVGFVKKCDGKWKLKKANVTILDHDFEPQIGHIKKCYSEFIAGKKVKKYCDITKLDNGEEYELSENVVEDFKKQLELSKDQDNSTIEQKNDKKNSNDPLGSGEPFFFATRENNPKDIAAIGLDRYFKISYELTPAQVAGESSYNDFSSSLFGFVDGNCKSKGKVSVGSLIFKEGHYRNYEPFEAALLTPHPSCLPHYLKQESERITHTNSANKVETLVHYLKCDSPKLRGRKFYWHRKFQKQPLDELNGNTNIISKLHPIVDASGDFEITVDRVSKEELGAIIMAIDLPKGCAHKLGSGKSLGMGSVRLEIKQFDVQEVSKKYESLEDRLNSFGKLQQEKFDSSKLTEYTDCFKSYVLTKLGEPSDDPSYYYEQKEINNLFKMLDYKNKPSNSKTENMPLEEFAKRKILNTIDEIYGNENSPFDE